MREAATIFPLPCELNFDLLTLKVVSESRVTWVRAYLCANVSLPRPLSVLDLGPMYVTDGQHHRFMPPLWGRGITIRY